MSDFKIALKQTLVYEGGYVNDPDDPGGETNYGITFKVARAYGYEGLMKDIPMYLVENIYFKSYWLPCKCDKINDQAIAEKCFDMAVNMGVRTSGKILQKAINLITKDKTIKVDGCVGGNTISAMLKCDLGILMKAIKFFHVKRYVGIITNRPKSRKYIRGWLRRV